MRFFRLIACLFVQKFLCIMFVVFVLVFISGWNAAGTSILRLKKGGGSYHNGDKKSSGDPKLKAHFL